MFSKWTPLHSASSPHYRTPADVYAALHEEFHFTLDPCPFGSGPLQLPGAKDGLTMRWRGERVYCNPPYGRGVSRWLERAREADIAVYLLPARTDTFWWHNLALKADEIRFLRGRLRFDERGRAPFPSVVLIYRSRRADS